MEYKDKQPLEPTPCMATRLGMLTRFPVSRTTFESGLTASSHHPHVGSNLVFGTKYAHPAYPIDQEIMPRPPFSLGLSRYLTSREGLPPTANFQFHYVQTGHYVKSCS